MPDDAVEVQRGREPPDVGQLGRAFDLRMARQDLLEQRRARARQPEDEDRRAVRIARAGEGREELRRIDLDEPVVHQLGLHRVVVHLGALPLVPLAVKIPGALVVAAVLEGLAEREQEVDPGLRGEAFGGGVALHRGDGLLVEAVGLQVGEAPVGLAGVRGEADAGVVRGHGSGVVAGRLEHVAEAEERAGMPGPQLEAVTIGGGRFRRE